MYEIPAFITSATDAELTALVAAHNAQLDRFREYDQSEFDYMDHMEIVIERDFARDELAQREVTRKYTTVTPLDNRPFVALLAAR